MQFRKKLKNFLIFLILVSFTTAQASPIVQRVKQGDTVPYTGWCLNDVAMAKIIADKEMEDQRCQLKLDKQRDQLNAKYHLEVSNLDLRIQSLEEELDSTILIKNEEIKKLEKIALDRPNDYWYLFAAGGFVVGAASVLGIWVLVSK